VCLEIAWNSSQKIYRTNGDIVIMRIVLTGVWLCTDCTVLYSTKRGMHEDHGFLCVDDVRKREERWHSDMRIYEVVTAACGDTKRREGGRAYTGTTDRSPGLGKSYLENHRRVRYHGVRYHRRADQSNNTTHHFLPSR
jgi:hypothetical protein